MSGDENNDVWAFTWSFLKEEWKIKKTYCIEELSAVQMEDTYQQTDWLRQDIVSKFFFLAYNKTVIKG